jgi:hypothetical protein
MLSGPGSRRRGNRDLTGFQILNMHPPEDSAIIAHRRVNTERPLQTPATASASESCVCQLFNSLNRMLAMLVSVTAERKELLA